MNSSRRGFTLIDFLVTLAVILVLAVVLVPTTRSNKKTFRLTCVNQLKQVGLAFRVWANDNGDKYPMFVPVESGGTMGLTNGVDTYRHFQVISNELSVPYFLLCPSDIRIVATNFTQFNNQNVSYFVGLDANETNISMFLAGDRNLTCDQPPVSGVLNLSPSQKLGWSNQIHKRTGNVALADGSVLTCSEKMVTETFRASGETTNVWRLSLPE